MADTLAVIVDHEATGPGSRTRETEKFEFSGNYGDTTWPQILSTVLWLGVCGITPIIGT